MSFKENFIRDTSAFGGLPIYFTIAFIALVLQKLSLFWQIAAGFIICYAVTTPIRAIYFKARPDKEKYTNWLTRLDASSFPSLHSMRVAVLAVVLANFFNSILITLAFAIAAIGAAIARVLMKKHYWSDIIAGAAIGIIIGFIMINNL